MAESILAEGIKKDVLQGVQTRLGNDWYKLPPEAIQKLTRSAAEIGKIYVEEWRNTLWSQRNIERLRVLRGTVISLETAGSARVIAVASSFWNSVLSTVTKLAGNVLTSFATSSLKQLGT